MRVETEAMQMPLVLSTHEGMQGMVTCRLHVLANSLTANLSTRAVGKEF